jgi:predicted nucleic acid-binding protein
MVVICNASPLIGLAKIDSLHILQSLWTSIIIPDAVFKETVDESLGRTGSAEIKKCCSQWITVATVKNMPEVSVLRATLDAGEAEVIVLAQEIGADLVVLDNREPRLFAHHIGLKCIGTIGILGLAYKKGIIPDPMNQLMSLRAFGFWVSDEVVNRFRKEFGV